MVGYIHVLIFLPQPYPTTIIDVPAGATLTAEWHHTLDGLNPSDGDDPISATHKGPIIAYLYVYALMFRSSPHPFYRAKVPSALQTDVTGLGWFKVWQGESQINYRY
jgi:hypothetical protein